MHIGHAGPTIQQPDIQAPTPLKPAATPTLKAQIEERSESRETQAQESARGEKVNKLV